MMRCLHVVWLVQKADLQWENHVTGIAFHTQLIIGPQAPGGIGGRRAGLSGRKNKASTSNISLCTVCCARSVKHDSLNINQSGYCYVSSPQRSAACQGRSGGSSKVAVNHQLREWRTKRAMHRRASLGPWNPARPHYKAAASRLHH